MTTYRDNTPTFNSGNRKLTNFRSFLQNPKEEIDDLKSIKKSFTKNELEVGPKQRKNRWNRTTHKVDDVNKDEVEDTLDSLEEVIEKSMKHIKTFNEMLDPMGSWNPNQINNTNTPAEGKIDTNLPTNSNILIELISKISNSPELSINDIKYGKSLNGFVTFYIENCFRFTISKVNGGFIVSFENSEGNTDSIGEFNDNESDLAVSRIIKFCKTNCGVGRKTDRTMGRTIEMGEKFISKFKDFNKNS